MAYSETSIGRKGLCDLEAVEYNLSHALEKDIEQCVAKCSEKLCKTLCHDDSYAFSDCTGFSGSNKPKCTDETIERIYALRVSGHISKLRGVIRDLGMTIRETLLLTDQSGLPIIRPAS